MKRWTLSVQHTSVVCLIAAACGCVGPRGPATPPPDSSAEIRPLSAERAAFADSVARYGVAVGQAWNDQGGAAFSNFLRAAELDPDNEELQSRVAIALISNQQFEEARAVAQRLAKRRPRSEKAQLSAAFIERITGNPEQALHYYERAIHIAPDSANGYLEKAAVLVRSGRADEAIAVLKSGLKRVRDTQNLARMTGQIYIRQVIEERNPARATQRAADALTALQPFANKGQRDEVLLLQMALLSKLSGNYATSLELLSEIEAMQPAESRWRQTRVASMFQGDAGAAVPAMRQLVAKDPDNPQLLLTLGHIEEQAKNIDKAEEAYRRAMRADPTALDPVLRLGLLLSTQKKAGEAERLFSDALKDHPTDARLLEFLAYLNVAEQQPLKALSFYEQTAAALKESGEAPLSPRFEASYLLACLEAEQPDGAVKLLKTSLENESPLLDVFVRFLTRERNPQRVERGIEVLRKLSESTPENPTLLSYIGLIQSSGKNFDAAMESFARAQDQAREVHREDETLTPTFYFWYGATAERTGRFDLAIEQFEKCIALKPSPEDQQQFDAYVDSLNYIAYMRAERGEDLERGLALINEALEAAPDNAAFLDTRGWIYFMQGKYPEARDDIERALSILPNDPTITDHLGDVYEKLGVIEEAADWWKKSFLLDPSNEKVAAKLQAQGLDLAALREEAAAQQPEIEVPEEADEEPHPALSVPSILDEYEGGAYDGPVE